MTSEVDSGTTRRGRAATWAAALTLLWILVVPLLLVLGFGAVFSLDGTPNPNAGYGAVLFLVAAAVGLLLPLTVTVIAAGARRPILAGVYLIITALLLIPAAFLVQGAAQSADGSPQTPPAEAPAPGACQEHSGGDTRCPGG